jgi:uncharacterized membrane protein
MLPTAEVDLGSTLLLIGSVLVFGVLLVMALICQPIDDPPPPGAHLRSPRETLDEHLSKGEITREEYVDRRRALDFKAAIV